MGRVGNQRMLFSSAPLRNQLELCSGLFVEDQSNYMRESVNQRADLDVVKTVVEGVNVLELG